MASQTSDIQIPQQGNDVTPRIAPRFNMTEFSGSLGDLGTFLPLTVALAITCRMDMGIIFIFAGLMNVISGLIFRQPIPVQPMKAIVAVAIAEGLTAGQVSAAGLIMGLAVLILAFTGAIDVIARNIPKPIVRGIQAGVGIKLAIIGIVWITSLSPLGWNSLLTVAILIALVAILIKLRQPALLYIFAAGFAVLWLANPQAYQGLSLGAPAFAMSWPAPADWFTGLTDGALVQLPLTLLNSVVAICALSSDYFPGRGIAPRKMATSVALMNLICVPFGAMPMCHGAGGLAAQYRFGARTGGSVIMIGLLKIIVGLAFGTALIGVLDSYPKSILGVMVIVAGLTLASAAKDSLRDKGIIVVIATAAVIVTVNTLAGFLVGCMLAFILYIYQSKVLRQNNE